MQLLNNVLLILLVASCLKGESANSPDPIQRPISTPRTYTTNIYPTNTPVYYHTAAPTASPLPFPTVSSSPVIPTVAPTIIITPTPTPTVPPMETIVTAIDPLGIFAWHIENTGQATFSENAGNPGEDINMNQAIANNLGGQGITIAVSDTGVEEDHEDLVQNVLASQSRNYTSNNPSSWRSSSNPSGPDAHPHGTHVAGIAAARGSNGLGSLGVAGYASIVPFQYINTNQRAVKKIDQASGPFDIFNFSYGLSSCTFYSKNQAYIDQLRYGITYQRSGKGSIYVKSAGNEYAGLLSECFDDIEEDDDTYYLGNANLEEDHAYPYYILVAGLNAKGTSASYSSPGANLWISAPAGEYGDSDPAIIAPDFMGCDQGRSKTSATRNNFESGNSFNVNCNYTSTMNGTSAAAPIISGAVALLLETNPHLTWRDIKYILAATARKVHSSSSGSAHPGGMNLDGHQYQQGWVTNAAGFNFHNWYGFGAINLDAAISMAGNYNPHLGVFTSSVSPSGVWSYQAQNLNLSIPDANANGVSSSITFSENRFVEAVQIKVDIDHDFVSDLGFELTSPSGTKSIILNINSRILQKDLDETLLLSNAFYGENGNGDWTLKVIDGAGDDVGVLNSWGLNIFGNNISPNAIAQSEQSPSLRRPAFDLETKNEETRYSSIDEQFFIIDNRNQQQFGIKGKCIHNGSHIKITGEITGHTICENNNWQYMLDFSKISNTKHTINIAEVVMETNKVLQTRPQVFFKNPYRSVTLGSSHTCGLVYDEIHCWGSNINGQLGLGDLKGSLHPRKLVHHGKVAKFKQVDANYNSTCGVLTSGAVRCWGNNGAGHLGSKDQKKYIYPHEFWLDEKSTDLIRLGQNHSCVIQQGAVKCFGHHRLTGLAEKHQNTFKVHEVLAETYDTKDLALGPSHSCALTKLGVYCWGDNRGGLFPGEKKYTFTPIPIKTWDHFSGVSNLKVGGLTTCALVNGGVQCLKPGFTKPSYIPAWPAGSNYKKISVGTYHICAANNEQIECLLKSKAFAGEIKSKKTFRYSGTLLEIDSGDLHHCAITTRQLFCFGRGESGQLGSGLIEENNWEGVYPQLLE